ncbi:MAG: DUF1554 domain-containing protein [Leptospiraceae bacterium]|nr:DUF1554 domain-containing protein [Leptospiraceae bacterium]
MRRGCLIDFIFIGILLFLGYCSKPFPDSSILPFLQNFLSSLNSSGPISFSTGSSSLINGNDLDFSTVRLKSNSSLSITLLNNTASSVSIDSTSISGTNSSEFSVTNQAGLVEGNSSISISINFIPVFVGSKTAFFIISYNNNQNSFSLNLKGSSIPDKYIFVSQGIYNGNLGGITGADSKCSTEKINNYSALPTGTYKALLADGTTRRACSTSNCVGGSSENSNWILIANQSYYNGSDNSLVFTTNSKGITSFPINSYLLSSTSQYWWTGMDTGWENTLIDNCSSWGATGSSGYRGQGGKLDSSFVSIGLGVNSCTDNLYIVCVEQ